MNEGKKFEEDFYKSVPSEWYVYRLRDAGGWGKAEETRFTPSNICDFILFDGLSLYLLELKSYAGKSIPFSAFNRKHLAGLVKAEEKFRVRSRIVANFRDISETYSISATTLEDYISNSGRKSAPISLFRESGVLLPQKKRISRFRYYLRLS